MNITSLKYMPVISAYRSASTALCPKLGNRFLFLCCFVLHISLCTYYAQRQPSTHMHQCPKQHNFLGKFLLMCLACEDNAFIANHVWFLTQNKRFQAVESWF